MGAEKIALNKWNSQFLLSIDPENHLTHHSTKKSIFSNLLKFMRYYFIIVPWSETVSKFIMNALRNNLHVQNLCIDLCMKKMYDSV